LSVELAPHGIRALCLRPNALPETATIDVVFGQHAKTAGMSREQFTAVMAGLTHRKHFPTLAEVASAAVFAASDHPAAITGTVLNLSGGSLTD
jgi:NAD(P)-dependent dehydrogenase (short-subunit alcohol dehydrogenase family)